MSSFQPSSPDVDALRDEHVRLWNGTAAVLPCLGPRTGILAKLRNARAARRLIDAVAAELERPPEGPDEVRAWRGRLRERIERFGEERLGWPGGYRRLLFGDEFCASTAAFVRRSRAFCPRLTFAELGQALRNVWIGNCLQVLLDLPVELGDGLFAYSMLYPLTDNWLDDPAVPARSKREFGRRFGGRLAGEAVAPVDPREAEVFALVGLIEQELPRASFPSVYESLAAIHEAQSRSLRQQQGALLPDDELLAISVAKGGSSVLADVHLVSGRPSPEQQRFAFGYGVFLQLLDDLQDVDDDLAAGHETLFTRAAHRGRLDAPTARLARLVDRVLDESGILPAPDFDDRKDLVRRNCRALLVGSVAEHSRLFSRRFRSELQARCPLSLHAQRSLRRRALRRSRRLAARHGEDALGSLLEAVAAPAMPAEAPSPAVAMSAERRRPGRELPSPAGASVAEARPGARGPEAAWAGGRISG